jgi:hypothetical protein
MSRILQSRLGTSLAVAIVACAISIPVLASAKGGGAATAVAAKKHKKKAKRRAALHGRSGRDGPAGREGKPGPEGKEGREGKPGADGKEGKEGPTGATGLAGTTGIGGATGVQGPTGQQGATGESGPSEALTNDNRSAQEVTSEDQTNPTVINSLTLEKGDYVISDDGWAQGLGPSVATIRCGIDTGKFAQGIGESLGPSQEGTVYVTKIVKLSAPATYKFICWRFDSNEMRFLESQLTAIKVGAITEK